MPTKQVLVLVGLALLGFSFADNAHPSPAPQNKRSKSDSDISAIGRRHIARDTNFYSPEKEKELGKALSLEVERSSRLITDTAVTEYIDRVTQNVAKVSDAKMPITVRVIDSNAVNAFTLPGGYQYINSGLLVRLGGEGELASALARGIAHTALRSSTRAATKGEMIQLANVPLILLGPGASTTSGTNVAIPLTVLKERRDDEFDADYFGVQYLYKAGYNPKCFTDFVQRIWGTTSLAGTYPPMDERLAALRKEISDILPPRDGAIVSTADFDAFKEHLPAMKPEGPQLKKPTASGDPHLVQDSTQSTSPVPAYLPPGRNEASVLYVILAYLNEPSLLEASKDPSIFSIRASYFSSVPVREIAVRLVVNTDGSGQIISAVSSGAASGVKRTQNNVSATDVNKLLQLLAEVQFWSISSSEDDDKKACAAGRKAYVMDGSAWMVERVHHGSFHYVYRRNPTPSPITQIACSLAMDLAKPDESGISTTLCSPRGH